MIVLETVHISYFNKLCIHFYPKTNIRFKQNFYVFLVTKRFYLCGAYDKRWVSMLHLLTEIWLNGKLFLMLIYVNAIFDVASTWIEAAWKTMINIVHVSYCIGNILTIA